jgi:hypothetical protein
MIPHMVSSLQVFRLEIRYEFRVCRMHVTCPIHLILPGLCLKPALSLHILFFLILISYFTLIHFNTIRPSTIKFPKTEVFPTRISYAILTSPMLATCRVNAANNLATELSDTSGHVYNSLLEMRRWFSWRYLNTGRRGPTRRGT